MDLDLTPGEQAALEPFALSDPEAVLSLAKGSPELLRRVLPDTTVERLQVQNYRPVKVSTQDFSFGVAAGEPSVNALNVRSGPSFEAKRQSLLKRLEQTQAANERQKLLKQITGLYSGKAGRSRARRSATRSAS